MAKKRRASGYRVTIRNPEKGVRISVIGKTKKQVHSRARKFVKGYLKNVEMGFHDASGFHPIRGSSDYSLKPRRRGPEGRQGSRQACHQESAQGTPGDFVGEACRLECKPVAGIWHCQ